jgi:hypothetical protein
VLWMCPIQWLDHYNLHKKGMMLLDVRLFLMSLEVIERVYTQEEGQPTIQESFHQGQEWQEATWYQTYG